MSGHPHKAAGPQSPFRESNFTVEFEKNEEGGVDEGKFRDYMKALRGRDSAPFDEKYRSCEYERPQKF